MKKLYNTLREVLTEVGFNIAPFGENTIDDGTRTVEITIDELEPVEAGFNTWQGTVTFNFINGYSWEENSIDLWEVLSSFIPLADRVDEEALNIVDNSAKLELLELPQYSDIITTHDEDTGNATSSVSVTLTFQY